MHTRGRTRTLRYTAVSALVVLTLTGFSTGRGHGHGTGDSDGGGGCSSSSQDHDSSSSTGGSGVYKDDSDGSYDDDSTGSGGSNGSTNTTVLLDATVEVVSCVGPDRPYATVKVTNRDSQAGTFEAAVTFQDADGTYLDRDVVEVTVAGNASDTAEVWVDASVRDDVGHCEPDPTAPSV
ncbi:hypothetical protein [Streptomyces sp. CRN 30]|uniref:hypothetical protein n=1 Tax=Streptomyces sp. CRN 30 TaxID=3075613 RepID=UPI002A82699F|nr:hypothetical protein [Streptomyces sp. CRN 30]